MAKFSLMYEKLCRAILTIFVVNVAILVHTLAGLIIVGLFPSLAAANATYRTWLLSDDRSWTVSQTWKLFHREWKSNLKSSQVLGYLQLVVGILLAYDYWIVNTNARTGMTGVVLSGFLAVLLVVFLLFSVMSWVMASHFDEGLAWIARTSLGMVVARPLCSLMLLCTIFLIGWVCCRWSGVFVGFGFSLLVFAGQAVVYSFGHLSGFSPSKQEEIAAKSGE